MKGIDAWSWLFREGDGGDTEVERRRSRRSVDLEVDVRGRRGGPRKSAGGRRRPARQVEVGPLHRRAGGRQLRAVVHTAVVDDEARSLRGQIAQRVADSGPG